MSLIQTILESIHPESQLNHHCHTTVLEYGTLY